MSGFFGVWRTDGVAVEPRFLEEVARHIHFRGPDGSQTWTKDGLGTCFAYLEGAAYLVRLSRGSRVWEAVKRPFRLIRKYGQDG